MMGILIFIATIIILITKVIIMRIIIIIIKRFPTKSENSSVCRAVFMALPLYNANCFLCTLLMIHAHFYVEKFWHSRLIYMALSKRVNVQTVDELNDFYRHY